VGGSGRVRNARASANEHPNLGSMVPKEENERCKGTPHGKCPEPECDCSFFSFRPTDGTRGSVV
jgi:hypothetical protein